MTIKAVFDNSISVPESIASLGGIRRFGDLIYKRQTLARYVQELLSAAGFGAIIVVSNAEDLAWLHNEVQSAASDDYYLYIPANLVALEKRDSWLSLLRQLYYARTNLRLHPRQAAGSTAMLLMQARLFETLIAERINHPALETPSNLQELDDLSHALTLADLRDPLGFVQFLTGNFEARYFNAIKSDDIYTITKTSTDSQKLKREYTFYTLLPPAMQRYFVQPYDYRDEGTSGSYKMERLFVPDVAVQWVHGALSRQEFERFLERVFHFLKLRPVRTVAKEQGQAHVDKLFNIKVAERICTLKRLPDYERLKPFFDNAFGGIDQLLARYFRLYERRGSGFEARLQAIGHGDLCFSNMLYGKSTQLLKLIDPKGALTEDELYTCPYYDLAKLSHSIMGGYDFINTGLYDLQLDSHLGIRVALDKPDHQWAADLFAAHLHEAGYDFELVRLAEASLFISMLPLHIDLPKKVIAFALTGKQILDQLESGQ